MKLKIILLELVPFEGMFEKEILPESEFSETLRFEDILEECRQSVIAVSKEVDWFRAALIQSLPCDSSLGRFVPGILVWRSWRVAFAEVLEEFCINLDPDKYDSGLRIAAMGQRQTLFDPHKNKPAART